MLMKKENASKLYSLIYEGTLRPFFEILRVGLFAKYPISGKLVLWCKAKTLYLSYFFGYDTSFSPL